MWNLLPGAAGTLLRGRGAWPAAGLAAVTYEAPPPGTDPYPAYFPGLLGPLPLLYGLAQRAQLAYMLRPGFPYRVPGLIQQANEQRLLAPLDLAAPVTLHVAASPVETPGRHSVAFDVQLEQGGQGVATCRSLYLARRDAGAPRHAGAAVEGLAGSTEAWDLAADEGRRYAAVSGDYNPVHLSPWLARLFGYERPLLHGMNAVARAAAAIERTTGQPLAALEAKFKRPILLPACVTLTLAQELGRFQVASGETIHLVGRFS
ncbi:MAG: acyl dehydratase [Cyanobacteria bacterium RYN_339]|nr:acyl dehydratase [Cyanobacteria bacterium RYN_339]